MHLLIRESLSFYLLTLNKLQQVWPNALLHYDKDVQRHLVLQRISSILIFINSRHHHIKKVENMCCD